MPLSLNLYHDQISEKGISGASLRLVHRLMYV
jgi:hypothetical protein